MKVLVVLLMLVLVGCGNEVPYGSPVPSGGDPDVSAAADRLNPMLELDFASSFAGLVVDHDKRIVYVYRKPDRKLDDRVRSAVTGVKVVLRDAKMSLRDAGDLRDRVMADANFWAQRGLRINGAGPKPDGSGVEVMTENGSSSDRKKLVKHYGTDAITVTKGSAVMVPLMTVRPTVVSPR
jgi:hypothetical protein